ncbi:HAD family hydrolase [Candidatus Bathyarchaeota archaeon]|nr:HAD family hydrolase [Candidatus Bathyarchaeota archaeon]MBS7630717.1 HAD family hydrolase [Candidatus Bathyarchaeota archaeon]
MRLDKGAKDYSRIKLIVFDLDGTLVNSTIDFPKMKKKMISYLESCGVPPNLLSPTETNVVILEKAEKVWNELKLPSAERKQIHETIESIMDEVEMEAVSTASEIKGASEAIRRLRNAGFKLAILTRSHRSYALEILKKLSMLQYFDLIFGRGETPKPKPYAEALTFISDLMKVKLSDILFVGDHRIDSECAENACVQFIGVKTGPRGEESWGGVKPDVLLESVADLPEYILKAN